MSFWVYILQSQKTGRFYCGHTNNLDRRLSQHNDLDCRTTRTTKVFEGPWEIIWSCNCADRSEAMKLEKFIKKRGVSRYLKKSQLAESR
ncbi:MAG: GIY-YIG nuclease family protein [Desulfobacterales bacterium]|nr:GIY-YIG nuclease family protein [Desulfobacterales bacterium]